MGALLRDVVELYEPLAEEKKQSLNLQLKNKLRIQGDRDLLFQAMANLLDNAIKYTPVHGEIKIRLDKLADTGRVTIADNGPGIPEAERQQVFQRFYRLEKSRTTPGSGLGLSLVGAVARIHDMNLTLEDNHPGVRILCEFPASPKAKINES